MMVDLDLPVDSAVESVLGLPVYLTRSEVANLARVTTQTISMWVEQEKLDRPRRVGHKYLFEKNRTLEQLGLKECEPK